MDEWTEYTLKIAYDLLRETNQFDEELEQQFLDVGNYCRGLGHNTLGRDRMLTNPEFTFHYDVTKWLHDLSDLPLRSFKSPSTLRISFRLIEEQFKIVNDELDRCNAKISRSQALKRVPLQLLWRRPVLLN